MAETPRRLAPTKDAIRDLAAHSGNACAYPGCAHPVIDAAGRLVAQLCHIEAAEPRGERFNPNMTNEQRRARGNLVFLCLRHHVETNDVEAWSVERMRQMKHDHEEQFREGAFVISELAIQDITKSLQPGRPITGERFRQHMNAPASKPEFELTPEMFQESLSDHITPLIERVSKLAPDTRALLTIVIERGEWHQDDLAVPADEIEQVTRMSWHRLESHLNTMARYRIAFLDREYDDGAWIRTHDLDGWAFWRDLKSFCEASDIEIGAIVNDLRFDLLD